MGDSSSDIEIRNNKHRGSKHLKNPELRKFFRTFYDSVESIKAAGSYATSGVESRIPPPGLHVDKIPVSVPLTEEGARTLIDKGGDAPFGRNGELKFDDTVRKTSEIQASRIHFANPNWDKFIDDLVKRAASGLGVPSDKHSPKVHAVLYKSLLYKPGSMFKAHKDAEKAPGMFGTMVVCLPSKHTGGTVVVHHRGDSRRLSSEEESEHSCTYFAWYADVTHEIEEVQTGYRWVLTYNLIRESQGACPSATALDSQTEGVVKALSLWPPLPSLPFLLYPLSHQYAGSRLSLSKLKGCDSQRARCVADACEWHGEFDVFLAQFELQSSWSRGDDVWSHETMSLSQVCDTTGFLLSSLQSEVSDENVWNFVNYNNRKIDSTSTDGDLGNEPTTVHDRFTDRVLVLVPKQFVHMPLFGTKPSSKHVGAVLKLLRSAGYEDTSPSTWSILRRLCPAILDKSFAIGGAEEAYLGHVGVTALFLRDKALFKRAVDATPIGKLWELDRWTELGEHYDLQIEDNKENAENAENKENSPWCPELDIYAAAYKSRVLSRIYRGLTLFFLGFCKSNPISDDPDRVADVQVWYVAIMVHVLNIITHHTSNEDVAVIMDVAFDCRIKYTLDQRKSLDDAVTAFVVRFKDLGSFAYPLIIELLRQLLTSDDQRRTFLGELVDIVLTRSIETFYLSRFLTYVQETDSKPNTFFRTEQTKKKPKISSARLIGTLFERASAKSQDLANKLLWKIADATRRSKKDIVPKTSLAVMHELLDRVETRSQEAHTSFKLLIETYISKNVVQEPRVPTDWARPEAASQCFRSQCELCPKMNSFLRDPTAPETTMRRTDADDRNHLRWSYSEDEGLKSQKTWVDPENPTSGTQDIRFTKTVNAWATRYVSWQMQVETVKANLRTLPQDKLEQVLGDEYESLMALDRVRIKEKPIFDTQKLAELKKHLGSDDFAIFESLDAFRIEESSAEQAGVGQSPDQAEPSQQSKRSRDGDEDEDNPAKRLLLDAGEDRADPEPEPVEMEDL